LYSSTSEFYAAEFKEQTQSTKLYHILGFEKIFDATRISQQDPLFFITLLSMVD
jgi:hypothetical protein